MHSTGYDAPEPTGNAMKRRSRAGSETIKGRRRKAAKPIRHNVSGTASPSNLTKDAEIARLSRELDKALEQQIATSKARQLISALSGDLQPVFDEILQNATRICEANFGVLLLFDGKNFRIQRRTMHHQSLWNSGVVTRSSVPAACCNT